MIDGIRVATGTAAGKYDVTIKDRSTETASPA